MRKSRHMRPFYRLLISLLAALILPSVILSASYSAALRWTVMETLSPSTASPPKTRAR